MDREERTNQGEQVPCEFTQTIYVSGHQGHNLGLAREVVLVVLLSTIVAFLVILAVFLRRRWRRGGHILTNECLCEKDGVELNL